MLSYRHSYHAGNFADVFKHVIWIQVLRALCRKATPFFVLDTHAGIGRYDLSGAEAQRNREYAQGIARLAHCNNFPAPVQDYLDLVRSHNPVDAELRFYPGSPCLSRALLRPQDRLLLTELHPADHLQLKQLFAGDSQVAVHKLDGYQALKAFLPPAEKRGLVLIDPAYERQDEYERVVANLQQAYVRWPNGVYVIWYPLLSHSLRERFHAALQASDIRKILTLEFGIQALRDRTEFAGSGMLMINPPWSLQTDLEAVMHWFPTCLGLAGQAWQRQFWLVPE